MKKRKDEAAAAAALDQTTLDSHLRDIPSKEHVLPYTDALFREAAIEWLISTDQVFFMLHMFLYLPD